MGETYSESVLKHVDVAVGVARIVESYHDDGAEISYCQRLPFIRLHLSPGVLDSRVRCDGSMVRTQAGHLMFFPARCTTHSTIHHRRLRSLQLFFREDRINQILASEGCDVRFNELFDPDLRSVAIENAMNTILSEMTLKRSCARIVIDAAATQIAVHLVRTILDDSRSAGGRLTSGSISLIEDYISNYRNGVPSLAEVANEVGLSIDYLRHSYRRATGRTLFRFIEDTRMARARKQLQKPGKPLKLIAHELGYSSASAFSEAFRKATGETPRTYSRRALL